MAGPSQLESEPLAQAPDQVSNPDIQAPEQAPVLALTPQAALALGSSLLRSIASIERPQPGQWWPALRILLLAAAAGFTLRLAGATLQAIDGLPLLGGLLELVGLVRLLSFLSTHALRQQKRAELLSRIDQLRRDLLG